MKGDVISTYVFDPNRNLLNSVIDQQTGSYQIPHSPVDGWFLLQFKFFGLLFLQCLIIHYRILKEYISCEKFKNS